MRVETIANMGAYCSLFAPFIPTMAALKVLPGVYDVQDWSTGSRACSPTPTPVDAYRGAGRPEAIYLIERLIDAAAREVGLDPAEFRRRNFIPPPRCRSRPRPARSTTAASSPRSWTRRSKAGRLGRLRQAPGRGREPRQAARHRHGLLHRVRPWATRRRRAKIRFEDDGTVSVLVGTQSNGQGHETAYAQILNDRLGIPFEKIRIVQGDTSLLASGGGTGGSRSLTAEGMAIRDASDLVIERGKHSPPTCSRPRPADIEFARGGRVPGDRHRPQHRPARARRQGAHHDPARRARGCPGWMPRRWPRSTPGPSPTAATSPRSRSTPTPA